MTHLSNKIISCGLCSNCNTQYTAAISNKEAQKIIDVCKAEFIEAIEGINPFATGSNKSASMQQAAIKAIEAIK